MILYVYIYLYQLCLSVSPSVNFIFNHGPDHDYMLYRCYFKGQTKNESKPENHNLVTMFCFNTFVSAPTILTICRRPWKPIKHRIGGSSWPWANTSWSRPRPPQRKIARCVYSSFDLTKATNTHMTGYIVQFTVYLDSDTWYVSKRTCNIQ